jgi:hypothetical protein
VTLSPDEVFGYDCADPAHLTRSAQQKTAYVYGPIIPSTLKPLSDISEKGFNKGVENSVAAGWKWEGQRCEVRNVRQHGSPE